MQLRPPPPPPHPWCIRACMQRQLRSIQHVCSVTACNYAHPHPIRGVYEHVCKGSCVASSMSAQSLHATTPTPPHPWCIRACMQRQLCSIQHVCPVTACNYAHPHSHPIRGVYEHVCKGSCVASNMSAQSPHAITPTPTPTPSVVYTSMYAKAVA